MQTISARTVRVSLAIGGFALLIRLLYISYYPISQWIGADPTAYWSYAQSIVAGQGFRSTYEPWLADRPPLYSHFLAAIIFLFGEDQQTVFYVQALLGAIAASLFYLVTARILDSRRACVAGVLFAIWPYFLYFTKQILTEPRYIPLLVGLLTILLLFKSMENNWLQWSLTGACLGLITLVRREAILPCLLIVGLIAHFRNGLQRKQLFMMMANVMFVTTLVVGPWLVRNWYLLGEPVLSSSGGWNFLVGNNPDATGEYTDPPLEWREQFVGLDEMARDRKAWDLSLGWIREDPKRFLHILPLKFIALSAPSHNLVLDGSDIGLLVLCFCGIVRVMHKIHGRQLVIAIVLPLLVAQVLITLVFVGNFRYRLVIYPGLLLLAAYGIPDFLINTNRIPDLHRWITSRSFTKNKTKTFLE